MNRRDTGKQGELAAAEYLRKHGYKVLSMSYYSPYGEIDIIAEKKKVLAFVEVKLRKNDKNGRACEAVDFRKQEKIRKTAEMWLMTHETSSQPRFDVVEIYTDTNTVNHMENAFE